jgi:hypothetical protein
MNHSMPTGQKAAIRQARFARRATSFVGAVLGIAFVWLKFRGIDIKPVVKTLPAQVVFHAALSIYYFLWMFGLTNDTREQELVYTQPPRNVVAGCIGFGILFSLVFWALCYVDTPRQFGVVLAVFLAFNVASWQLFIRYFMKNATRKTRSEYMLANDFVGLEQFKVVHDEYLCGIWQWARFAVGGVIVTIICVLAFQDSVVRAIEQFLSSPIDIVLSLLLLLFILVMEVWIWIMRFRVKDKVALLDHIEREYGLQPKRAPKRATSYKSAPKA